MTKEFAAKEKLETVLSALVQGETGGRDGHEQIAAGRKQDAQFRNPGPYLSACRFLTASTAFRSLTDFLSIFKIRSNQPTACE